MIQLIWKVNKDVEERQYGCGVVTDEGNGWDVVTEGDDVWEDNSDRWC